jgi:hypothetical protein
MAASRVPKACGEQMPQNPSQLVSSFGQTRHHHPRCRRATLRSAPAPLWPGLFYAAEAQVLSAVTVITKRLILRSVRFPPFKGLFRSSQHRVQSDELRARRILQAAHCVCVALRGPRVMLYREPMLQTARRISLPRV